MLRYSGISGSLISNVFIKLVNLPKLSWSLSGKLVLHSLYLSFFAGFDIGNDFWSGGHTPESKQRFLDKISTILLWICGYSLLY
jgi:hypothetical protein